MIVMGHSPRMTFTVTSYLPSLKSLNIGPTFLRTINLNGTATFNDFSGRVFSNGNLITGDGEGSSVRFKNPVIYTKIFSTEEECYSGSMFMHCDRDIWTVKVEADSAESVQGSSQTHFLLLSAPPSLIPFVLTWLIFRMKDVATSKKDGTYKPGKKGMSVFISTLLSMVCFLFVGMAGLGGVMIVDCLGLLVISVIIGIIIYPITAVFEWLSSPDYIFIGLGLISCLVSLPWLLLNLPLGLLIIPGLYMSILGIIYWITRRAEFVV